MDNNYSIKEFVKPWNHCAVCNGAMFEPDEWYVPYYENAVKSKSDFMYGFFAAHKECYNAYQKWDQEDNGETFFILEEPTWTR